MINGETEIVSRRLESAGNNEQRLQSPFFLLRLLLCTRGRTISYRFWGVATRASE